MQRMSTSGILSEFVDPDSLLEILGRDDLTMSARLAALKAWAEYETAIPVSDPAFTRAIDQCIRYIVEELASLLPGDEASAREFMQARTRALFCGQPSPAWTWPIVEGQRGCKELDDTDWPLRSALKMFGYTVGKTAGWPSVRRQRFLTDFIELELPSAVSAQFGSEYGRPLTTDRLRKVANVIASNCGNFMRNDPQRYATAIRDYEDDLSFLKKKYYEGKGLKFVPWPDPRVRI